MPTGLRATDAPLIQRLVGGDMKLLMRLGALLQDGMSISEPALQFLTSTNRTALLTDRRLKALAKDPAAPAAFAALADEHQIDDLVLARDGTLLVIALADEVGNPLLAALAPEVEAEVIPPSGLSAVVASLAPALRLPVEGLLAARADDQRAAALEQLRYAMPPLAVVSELMPMLLADGADIVRERAIALLVASGAHVAVVDCIRAIQRGDDGALFRHGESLSRLPRAQQELMVSALIAHLARGNASPGLVALARHLAALLAGHPALDRLIDLLLPRKLSLIELVRALQAHDRLRIDAILARNLGQDVDQDAQLIVLLASPDAPPADHPLAVEALLDRGIALLLAAEPAPRERMALAGALRRLDGFMPVRALAARIAARGEAAIARAFDTSVYWLLAELCRDGAVDPATGERLAEICRKLLRDGSGPHLVSLLEQQLPALLPASPAARLALVEPAVETVARFHDDRSRDVVIACVLALGPGALAGLWTSLQDHPRREVRLLCAELVPDLLLLAGGAAALRDGIDRLLAITMRTTDTTERAALVTAAARAAVAPEAAEVEDLHQRVLAATNGLGDHGMEALGHLAASPACAPALRDDLLQRMLRTLVEEVPDSPVQTAIDPTNQEVTFLLDDALTRHTDTLPRVLRALERIGSSPAVPVDTQRLVLERLCRQWKRVSTWQSVWGPGNIRELGETIARLGERADCPVAQRVLAAESLLTGANQLSIARALARVFIAGEGTYLATIAGRAVARLVQLAAEDYYADDERPDLVEVLVDYLAIPRLGKEDASLRRRLVNLIATMHASATTRARLRLRYLRAELDQELREKIDWA